jgi:hypothetical protein
LLEESFEGNDIPESWEIVENSVGGVFGPNSWNYNGLETEAGRVSHNQFILVVQLMNQIHLLMLF